MELRKGSLAGKRFKHMKLTYLFENYMKAHLMFPHVIINVF